MSAGGLSYDCLTTSRKVTLPSVEMWGTNMNILKNPPSSIYTKRRDKVGDTQQVLLAQEDSGDRIAECINVYARGVNPMVSVSYDNYGNNAGTRSTIVGNGKAVKLPYKPEVFRPPVFRQEDITPLSRLPRNWFYALSNPEMPNIVNQMSCPEGKSSVWDGDKLLRVDAPARIQYNNESTLKNSSLPSSHGSLRQDPLVADRTLQSQISGEKQIWMNRVHDPKNIHSQLLQSDRRSVSHGRGEKQVWMNQHTDPKYTHQKVLQANVEAGQSMPFHGSDKDIIQSMDPKSIQQNKLLYQVFSNKSGNKNLADPREMVKTIQDRALHQGPLNIVSIEDNISLDHLAPQLAPSYHESNSHSFGNKLREHLLRIEQDTQLSGMYVGEGQHSRDNAHQQAIREEPLHVDGTTQLSNPYNVESAERGTHFQKGADNDYLYKEVLTRPDQSGFSGGLQDSQLDPSNTKAVHENVPIKEHVTNRQDPNTQFTLAHHSLSREPHRELPSMTSYTNKSGLYTKQDIRPAHLASGRIEKEVLHSSVQAPKAQPQFTSSIESFQNVPISVREDVLKTSVTSASTGERSSLQDILYNDTVMPASRHNVPMTQAFTQKTFLDKTEWLADKNLQPKRMANIETTTFRDPSNTLTDLYALQSTDAQALVSHAPQAGSFDPTPSAMPRLHRDYDHGSEMPVHSRYSSLKSRASSAYFERYSVPMPT